MTDEASLLAAISAAPADDVPRLVYADWLDEQGHSIPAEFIRLQIEIARLETGPRALIDRNVQLWVRQQQFLDAHTEDLLAGQPELARLTGSRLEFRRGFLAELTCTDTDFLMHADALARLQPRPDVKVHSSHATPANWANTPGGELVVELNLSESGYFTEGHDPTWWRQFPRLRVLNLADNNLGDARLETIPWPDLPALIDLDVSNNALSDSAVIHLINRGVPQRLERLILGGNPLTDQSAYELADRTGRSQTLRHLNLRYTLITRTGQNAILAMFGGRVDLF